MPPEKPKIAEVTWAGPTLQSGKWAAQDSVTTTPKIVLNRAVGYVLRHDDKVLVLAQEVSPPATTSSPTSTRGVFTIPTNTVENVSYLRGAATLDIATDVKTKGIPLPVITRVLSDNGWEYILNEFGENAEPRWRSPAGIYYSPTDITSRVKTEKDLRDLIQDNLISHLN